MAQEPIDVSFVPDDQFNLVMTEVMALPPRKRAKWHKSVMDSQGTLRRVSFVNGTIGYTQFSKWIMIAPLSESQNDNILPADDARHEEACRRAFDAFETGGSAAVSQEHVRLVDEAATGNHRSKPHKIKVPTKAGEPVRA